MKSDALGNIETENDTCRTGNFLIDCHLCKLSKIARSPEDMKRYFGFQPVFDSEPITEKELRMPSWSPYKDDLVAAHFKLKELWCPCCFLYNITPTALHALSWFRELAGVPMFVTSGSRCAKYNKKIGGSPTSQHLLGQAFDITCPDLALPQLLDLAEKVPCFYYGGIGLYPQRNFIHVDCRSVEKPSRWGWLNGKMVELNAVLNYCQLQS